MLHDPSDRSARREQKLPGYVRGYVGNICSPRRRKSAFESDRVLIDCQNRRIRVSVSVDVVDLSVEIYDGLNKNRTRENVSYVKGVSGICIVAIFAYGSLNDLA